MKKGLQNLAMCMSILVGAQINAQASWKGMLDKTRSGISYAQEKALQGMGYSANHIKKIGNWMGRNPGKTIGAALLALGITAGIGFGAKTALSKKSPRPKIGADPYKDFLDLYKKSLNEYREKLRDVSTTVGLLYGNFSDIENRKKLLGELDSLFNDLGILDRRLHPFIATLFVSNVDRHNFNENATQIRDKLKRIIETVKPVVNTENVNPEIVYKLIEPPKRGERAEDSIVYWINKQYQTIGTILGSI